jgi:hypothetical protein
MQTFTDAFKKARETVTTQKFAPEWEIFLQSDGKLSHIFSDCGPKAEAISGPGNIARKIDHCALSDKMSTGSVILAAATNQVSNGSVADRAGTLKMARHMRRSEIKSSQSVWVYSPPKSHSSWIFDLLGSSATNDAARLSEDEELFDEEQIKWMMTALTQALKVSEDVKIKVASLASASDTTKQFVKRWFLDESCGDAELADAMAKLNDGFKKIAVACNSPSLVFTDYPNWSAVRQRYFGGAIRGGEGGGFPVIYLEGAFTRLTGNTGKLWLCVETIIHEMSHHELKTHDHLYDSDGLKPNSTTLPYAKAIENADSWGYFAIDLAGQLSESDRQKVLK